MLGFRITSHAAGRNLADENPAPVPSAPPPAVVPPPYSWGKILFTAIVVMLVLLVLAGGVAFSLFLLLPAHVPGAVTTEKPAGKRIYFHPKLPHFPDARSGNGTNDNESVRLGTNECAVDPPILKGYTREWDGHSRHVGTVVQYKCPNEINDVVVKRVVCRQGFWYLSTLRPYETCSQVCDERPPRPKGSSTWDWDGYSKHVGVTIQYRCHKDLDAPIFKEIMCTKEAKWKVKWKSPLDKICSCKSPPVFENPYIVSKGAENGTPIGAVVDYWCRSSNHKEIFQTIECSSQVDWVVTKKGSCLFFVEMPMTLSEAISYCNESGSELFHVSSEDEQNALVTLLRDEPALKARCRHKAFLGIIEDKTQQWELEDGTLMISSSVIWDSMDSGRKRCAVMYRPRNYKLRNAFCDADHHCHVCEINGTVENSNETGCTAGQICYLVGKEKGDYRFATFQCRSYGGVLAKVKDKETFLVIRTSVEADTEALEKCESFYVGAKSRKRSYKTISGDPVTYVKFVEDSARTMSRHCVVIHEFVRYYWTDEDCSSKSCFICRKKGNDLGLVVSFDNIGDAKERAVLKGRQWQKRLEDQDSRTQKCPVGWKSHGFHCFYFNTTKISHREADAFCRRFRGAELASMSIPFERNFILEQLLTAWDPAVHQHWHVESIAGLPQLSDDLPPPIVNNEYEDDDLYVYSDELEENDTDIAEDVTTSALRARIHLCVVVQLTPVPAWSRKSCNDEAAFICHM